VADIEVRRAHGLGIASAREAADRLLVNLESRFGLRGAWEGNVLHFERPGVTGRLAVGESDVHLTVALGFLLKAMRGSIESAVERELDTLFAGPTPSAPSDAAKRSR